jgi:hypothetical protein
MKGDENLVFHHLSSPFITFHHLSSSVAFVVLEVPVYEWFLKCRSVAGPKKTDYVFGVSLVKG